jgi:hypothetical protein
MIVGYHNVGDYHFSTILSEGVRALVERDEATFLDYDSFAGMVAGTHESFHIYQSLVSGTCCAVASSEDHFVAAFREAMSSRQVTDLLTARRLSADCKNLRDLFYNAAASEDIFLRAQQSESDAADYLAGLSEISTVHLLECQAALLTEFFVSGHMLSHPDAYDTEVVKDLSADFRLELMPTLYRLPLDHFRALIGRIIPRSAFETASRQSPIHRCCPNVVEYRVLAFLLDYALHIPPLHVADPEDLSRHQNIYREDYNPAVRFAKLLEALLADLSQDQLGLRSPELPEIDLFRPYESLSPRLSKWVDIGDLLSRAEAMGTPKSSLPTPQTLFPLRRADILKALSLPEATVTFLPFSETSERWVRHFREMSPPTDFRRLMAIRSAAMKIRYDEPHSIGRHSYDPLSFFMEAGLPVFYSTPTGLMEDRIAFTSLQMRMRMEEYDPDDLDWIRFDIVAATPEPDGENITLHCYTAKANLWVVRAVAWRQVLFRICESMLTQTPMTCPLAIGPFAQLSCDARGDQCGRIEVPDQLPPRPGCIARALYETYVGGAPSADYDT